MLPDRFPGPNGIGFIDPRIENPPKTSAQTFASVARGGTVGERTEIVVKTRDFYVQDCSSEDPRSGAGDTAKPVDV
jgi:hypothetical protein